jgi:peptidyl-prolyl cis-trans isomerase SurA
MIATFIRTAALGFAALAAALAAPLAAPPAQAQSQAEGVAVIVNDQPVTTFDVRQRGLLILINAGIEPTEESFREVANAALRQLIDEALQLQEARRVGVDVPDKEVTDQFARLARANQQTPQQFEAALRGTGVSPNALRQQMRAEATWQRLVGRRYGGRVRISDGEINETMQRIMANATRPQYLLSEILLPADDDSQAKEADALGQSLIDRMRQGARFPQVARQFSRSSTAAVGGDLGWLAENELPSDLVTAIKALQPGQVSAPVRTARGVMIVALREKRDGVDPIASLRIALMEVAAPAASRAALDRVLTGDPACAQLEAAIKPVAGAKVTDLGVSAGGDLSDELRNRVARIEAGRNTGVFTTADGVAGLVVCEREGGGPTRDDVENRLYDQGLAQAAQGYLRNLRREANIRTARRS